jgi:predicted Rossmann-fold nucleotide-binding protein
VVTGGYGGLMAAASRGAAEAGGHAVGLPMRGWADLVPNRWNNELRWSQSYPERLARFLATDAVVVLDGGIGTLSEAALVWAARQTEPKAPELVFLGSGWGRVLESLAAHLVIDERDLAWITICGDPEQAAEHIARSHSGARRPGLPMG